MSEQTKSIVNQAYSSFKNEDIEALLNLLAEDITWTLPEMEGVPFSGARSGRESVGEFFQKVGDTQESVRFDPRELIAEGDRVIALGSYTWRVKATGREFTSDFAHAWTIRDGKAVDFREYMDTAAAVAAHLKSTNA